MASIYDVAALAHVSTATVSAVINGQDKVEAKTRRRVQAAIKKLHYQPNLYARNLARGRSQLLGLIISDVVNPFFGELAQSIRLEAQARGYELSLASTQFSEEDLILAVKRMVGMRVMGLAIMTTEMSDQVLEILQNSHTPAVFEDVGTVSETISNVRIDYEGGILKALKYLVDLGHKRILFVRSYFDMGHQEPPFLSIRARTEAFKNAAKEFRSEGIDSEIVTHWGPGPKAGQLAIHQALDASPGFTAVIAIADTVALGVLRGLQQRGVRVPTDVSVVGFDNNYLCEYLCPPLTSVDIPRAKLGKMVVSCLVKNIEDREPGHELFLDTELVVRESATRFSKSKVRKHPARFSANPSSLDLGRWIPLIAS